MAPNVGSKNDTNTRKKSSLQTMYTLGLSDKNDIGLLTICSVSVNISADSFLLKRVFLFKSKWQETSEFSQIESSGASKKCTSNWQKNDE